MVGYVESKRLSFAVACEALLGIRLSEEDHGLLVKHFTIFDDNILSMPLDLPGTGLHKVSMLLLLYFCNIYFF